MKMCVRHCWLPFLSQLAVLADAWGAARTLVATPTTVDLGSVAVFTSAGSTVTLTVNGGSVTVTGFTPSAQCTDVFASASVNGQPVSASNPAVVTNKGDGGS